MPVVPGIIILTALIVLGILWVIIERYFVRRAVRPSFFAELKALADEGVLQARYVLAKCYPRLIENPVEYMLNTAELGHKDAQAVVMKRYMKHKILAKNTRQAAEWATKAAEQGSVAAQYQLYRMYRKGIGVKKDFSQAYFWLLMALEEPARKQKLLPQHDILKFQQSQDKKTKALWRLYLEDWVVYRDELKIRDELIKKVLRLKLEKKLTAEEIETIRGVVSDTRKKLLGV